MKILIVGRGESATIANMHDLDHYDLAYFCNGAVELAPYCGASHKAYSQYDGPTHPNPCVKLSAVDFSKLPDIIDFAVVPIRERQSYSPPFEKLQFFDFYYFTKNGKPVPTAFMAMLHAISHVGKGWEITVIGMDAYRPNSNVSYSDECPGPKTIDIAGQKRQIVERFPDNVLDKIKHFDGEAFFV